MFDPRELAPEVHEKTYSWKNAKGEERTVTFHVREAGIDEVEHIANRAKAAQKAKAAAQKAGKSAPEDEHEARKNFRELFEKFVVEDDGTPLTPDKVDGMVAMGFKHMKLMADIINEVIGLKDEKAKDGEEKKD